MTLPDDPNTPGNSNPATNPAGDGVDIPSSDVAQGRWGTRTVVILAVSLVLVVLALFGLAALNAGRVSAHGGPGGGGQEGVNSAPSAQVFNAPEPSPKQNPPPAAVQAATPTTSGS